MVGHPVVMILSGSVIPQMQDLTLCFPGPLYGLHTLQIFLEQIPFRDFVPLFPGRSRRELTELYAGTGGAGSPGRA